MNVLRELWDEYFNKIRKRLLKQRLKWCIKVSVLLLERYKRLPNKVQKRMIRELKFDSVNLIRAEERIKKAEKRLENFKEIYKTRYLN